MSSQHQIPGLKTLRENLNKLPDALQKKILRKAFYKSSRVPISAVREQIDANFKIRTGALRKRIGARVIYRRATKQMVMIIGPLITKGGTKEERDAKREKMGIQRDPYYSRFLEFDTKHMQGRHYYQKAFYQSKAAWVERFRDEVAVVLETEVRKMFGFTRKSR